MYKHGLCFAGEHNSILVSSHLFYKMLYNYFFFFSSYKYQKDAIEGNHYTSYSSFKPELKLECLGSMYVHFIYLFTLRRSTN